MMLSAAAVIMMIQSALAFITQVIALDGQSNPVDGRIADFLWNDRSIK